MTQEYYLKTGERVTLVEELVQGYLVKKVVGETYKGRFYEDRLDDVICVDTIYDYPPVYLYDERIVKLRKEVKEWEDKVEKIKSVFTQQMSILVNTYQDENRTIINLDL